MKQNTISLRLIAEQAEKHGLAVFDITRMPVYDEPIVLPYVTIALVNSGYQSSLLPETLVFHRTNVNR